MDIGEGKVGKEEGRGKERSHWREEVMGVLLTLCLWTVREYFGVIVWTGCIFGIIFLINLF